MYKAAADFAETVAATFDQHATSVARMLPDLRTTSDAALRNRDTLFSNKPPEFVEPLVELPVVALPA